MKAPSAHHKVVADTKGDMPELTMVNTHPLAEILARKLFGIENLPLAESRRMVYRAIMAAVKYHDERVKAILNEGEPDDE